MNDLKKVSIITNVDESTEDLLRDNGEGALNVEETTVDVETVGDETLEEVSEETPPSEDAETLEEASEVTSADEDIESTD